MLLDLWFHYQSGITCATRLWIYHLWHRRGTGQSQGGSWLDRPLSQELRITQIHENPVIIREMVMINPLDHGCSWGMSEGGDLSAPTSLPALWIHRRLTPVWRSTRNTTFVKSGWRHGDFGIGGWSSWDASQIIPAETPVKLGDRISQIHFFAGHCLSSL